MVHLIETGEVRGLLGICNNPFVSMPNARRIEDDYAKLEFHVQLDFFLSETAAKADVVLPVATWAEEGGVTTNAEGRVVLRHKAAEPPGEARSDWWVVCELARRLGRGDGFAFGSIDAIFEELRGASKGGIADYSGITYERLEETGGLFWPVPAEDHPGTPRLFEERFGFPDGKARFNAVEWREPTEPVDETYPLRLTTGRTVAHFLSGNQTRRIGALVDQAPRPWVEVHPSLGFAGGDLVRVVTRRGEVTLPALVTDTIRRRHGVRAVPLGAPGSGQPAHRRRVASDLEDPRVQGVRVPRGAGRRDDAGPGPSGAVRGRPRLVRGRPAPTLGLARTGDRRPMMGRTLFVDAGRCIGCQACVARAASATRTVGGR